MYLIAFRMIKYPKINRTDSYPKNLVLLSFLWRAGTSQQSRSRIQGRNLTYIWCNIVLRWEVVTLVGDTPLTPESDEHPILSVFASTEFPVIGQCSVSLARPWQLLLSVIPGRTWSAFWECVHGTGGPPIFNTWNPQRLGEVVWCGSVLLPRSSRPVSIYKKDNQLP